MTLNAVAKQAPSGAIGFDIDTPITASLAEAAIEAGMSFVVRYGSLANSPRPGDLTAAEAAIILKSGLALMLVQHVLYAGWSPTQALGQEHGQEIVDNAQAIGLPKGMNVWLDLEGVKANTSAANVIAYCNAWTAAVAGAGFIPGVYVGANAILSGEQLYEDLALSYYWKSGSKVPAVTRGFCMVQTIGAQYKLHGIAYDRNVIQQDGTGQTPWWAIPALGGVQAQSEEAPMSKSPALTAPVPTPAASAPTSTLTQAFDALTGFNWSQVSDIVEGKATLQEGVTTVEELANTLAKGATILGVPLAGTIGAGLQEGEALINAYLPVAASLISLAKSFLPAATGILGTTAGLTGR